MRGMLMKHQMSTAADLEIQYEIDAEAKLVTLQMPFFDSALVEWFVLRCLAGTDYGAGLDIIRDDNAGWHPPRPAWRMIAEVAGQPFTLEMTRLMRLGGNFDRYALVLEPVN